tara:strand:+ start:217 stop:474 length:258 start_codon:yes stop_codon:yes gene_type:complete
MYIYPIAAQVADSTSAASHNSSKIYAVNTAAVATEYLITIKNGSATFATFTLEGQQSMIIGKNKTYTIEAANSAVKFTAIGTASK